jgi:hypothetical protein
MLMNMSIISKVQLEVIMVVGVFVQKLRHYFHSCFQKGLNELKGAKKGIVAQ